MALQSITDLFLAGVIPGLIMAAALMLVVYSFSKKNSCRAASGEEAMCVRQAFAEAKWSLLVPTIILGGIYGVWLLPQVRKGEKLNQFIKIEEQLCLVSHMPRWI